MTRMTGLGGSEGGGRRLVIGQDHLGKGEDWTRMNADGRGWEKGWVMFVVSCTVVGLVGAALVAVFWMGGY